MLHSPEAGEEAAAARQQEERERDNEHVAEVNRGGHEATDVQLRVEVPHRVHEQIPGTRPRGQERTPPPGSIVTRSAAIETKTADKSNQNRTRRAVSGGQWNDMDDNGHHREAEATCNDL